MPLADTVARVRTGLFQILFLDQNNDRLGGGSAFLVNDLLVTNNHVYAGYQSAHLVGLRRDDTAVGQCVPFSPQEFSSRLVTGSMENSFDYAVLRFPELIKGSDHQFSLVTPTSRRIGETIALLGYPLEHDNLTCHQGIISSFYRSAGANVIQIDASVNAGNSGGPLFDSETGEVIGIITRKATGLSRLFKHLHESIDSNVAMVSEIRAGMSIGGFNPVEGFKASQNQIRMTLNEIERQANVGIGYAFSVEHILDEACFSVQLIG